MSTQLLFYANAKPVNAVEHRDLCVKTGSEYGFARELSAVPLTAAEFPLAAAEYAIVFAGTDGICFLLQPRAGNRNGNDNDNDNRKHHHRAGPDPHHGPH